MFDRNASDTSKAGGEVQINEKPDAANGITILLPKKHRFTTDTGK